MPRWTLTRERSYPSSRSGRRHWASSARRRSSTTLASHASMPLRYDTVQTYRGRIDAWDAKVVEERLRALEAQCLRPLLDEGYDLSRVNVQRGIDFRYVGQNYELEIGWVAGGPGPLKAAFEARHRQLYGYATGENVECVNLRVTARAVQEPLPLPPPPVGTSAVSTGSHRAY